MSNATELDVGDSLGAGGAAAEASTVVILTVLEGEGVSVAPFPALTDREREVLDRIAEGLTNQQIADRLCISPRAVSNHNSDVLAKLHVDDRAAAIVRAREAGLGRSLEDR